MGKDITAHRRCCALSQTNAVWTRTPPTGSHRRSAAGLAVCARYAAQFPVCRWRPGLLYGYKKGDEPSKKGEHYKLIQSLAGKYKEENGSIICRELLSGVAHTDGSVPEARTNEYYKKRPCAELVECAARILEEYIEEREK